MDFSTLEDFGDSLKAKVALPGSASPEDQLKPVVAELFKAAGSKYGLTVETRTEAHLSEHKVRPDIAVYVGGPICGYIELKAPGLGADALRLKGDHNKKQWGKLKGLPNLIYTDGREWALYRTGERPDARSDEHTSELQALMRNSYAVFLLKNNPQLRTSPVRAANT